MRFISNEQGRQAFGESPKGYERGRPGYPQRVFDILREKCRAGVDTRAFEIGPGTGQATRPVLTLGVSSLTAIEADARLASHLKQTLGEARRLTVIAATFEEAMLAGESFDLGLAATSFHWLEESGALRKIVRLLRPGGWWTCWWNVFGDPNIPDPFRDATQVLFKDLPQTPSQGAGGKPPFALDFGSRTAELALAGFRNISSELIRQKVIMDTETVLALYATFSMVSTLPEAQRREFLRRLETIVRKEFGGSVERHILTPVYWAQKA